MPGVRQDFGPGSHTHLAFGVEGLAPYWFEVEATGYVADDGALSARLKGTYDLLFTNRLILTPEVEVNLVSEAEAKRDVGAGPVNIELSLRLRYEFSRKFRPMLLSTGSAPWETLPTASVFPARGSAMPRS